MARGLAGRKVISPVSLDVISFLGEFGLSSLEISLSLLNLLHMGDMGRI